jgi:DNA-binding NarL/FixJ family response regulator
MLTNLNSSLDKAEAIKLGAAGYFVKVETEPADLLKLVKKSLKD